MVKRRAAFRIILFFLVFSIYASFMGASALVLAAEPAQLRLSSEARAEAEKAEWNLEAQSLSYDREKQLYEAEGKVRLTSGDRIMARASRAARSSPWRLRQRRPMGTGSDSACSAHKSQCASGSAKTGASKWRSASGTSRRASPLDPRRIVVLIVCERRHQHRATRSHRLAGGADPALMHHHRGAREQRCVRRVFDGEHSLG